MIWADGLTAGSGSNVPRTPTQNDRDRAHDCAIDLRQDPRYDSWSDWDVEEECEYRTWGWKNDPDLQK